MIERTDDTFIDQRFYTPRAQAPSAARGSVQTCNTSKSSLEGKENINPQWTPFNNIHRNPLTLPPPLLRHSHVPTEYHHYIDDDEQEQNYCDEPKHDAAKNKIMELKAYPATSNKVMSPSHGLHGSIISEADMLLTSPGIYGHTTSETESGQEYAIRVFSLARHGRVEEVDLLLQQGVPIDSRDDFGNTILCIACQNGNKAMMKLALRFGANVNIGNFRGNTPLHFCYRYGYANTLGKYLLERGANASLRNLTGELCTDMSGA